MSRLTEDLALGLEKLSRLVLSQPIDKTCDPKISVRPVTLRGRRLYQVERFRDNKAFHENLEGESLLRLVEADFDGRYRQALLVTETESAQYSMKAGGDYKRHGGAAVPRPAPTGGNNREKQYLLPEGSRSPPWWIWGSSPRTIGSSAPSMTSTGRSTASWSSSTRPSGTTAGRSSPCWTSAAARAI